MRRIIVAGLALVATSSAGCNSCSPRPHVGVKKPDAGPAVVVVEQKHEPAKSVDGGLAAAVLVDEKEPDDDLGRAQPLEYPKGIRGTLTPSAPGTSAAPGARVAQVDRPDVDVYQWLVSGDLAKQVARIELASEGAARVEALDGDGQPLVAGQTSEGGVDVIPNLFVEVGKTYYLRVRAARPGKDSAKAPTPAGSQAAPPAAPIPYTLVVRATALEPGEEEEPNDNVVRATPLVPGVESSGYFGRTRDEDWLKLPTDLPGASTLRLELTVPDGVAASLRVRDIAGATLAEAKGGRGQELRLRNAPAAAGGSIILRAESGHDVDQRWRLRFATEPVLTGAETEPNDTPSSAMRLDSSTTPSQIAGFLWPADADVYRIRVDGVGSLRVEATPPPSSGGANAVDLRLERISDEGTVLEKARAEGPRDARVQRLPDVRSAGRDVLVRVTGGRTTAFDAPYTLSWTFTPGTPGTSDGADGGK